MFVLVMTLLGCSTKQPKAPAKPLQQMLLIKCPNDLPEMHDGTGRSVLNTLRAWSAQYHRCAVLHNALIDALEGR